MTVQAFDMSRSQRLKHMTRGTHDRLDTSIMSAASFDSVEGYVRFAAIQYVFHRDIEALYDDARLQALIPRLAERGPLQRIADDLADLHQALPQTEDQAFFMADNIDVPTALGWLYVAEGSKMGGALLRKEAAKIGLSDTYGARHLAPAPEGPAPHWRAFGAALDAVDLTQEEEARVVAGANAAFTRVQALVDARIG